MKLVIVESPSKTKTIKQYLGPDYQVVASKGHIRDIENTGKDNLGLDFENGLTPIYSIIPKQYSTIKMLNEYVAKADEIYLATDPDREGEAISWHLKEVLNINNKPVHRIEFNEITEPAIKKAMDAPRDIDMNLVHSQETRKIIDRIIGYRLSGILKKQIGSINPQDTVSAGRVQSAALRIVTDKEEEIKKFVPKQFFEIEAENESFKAKLLEKGKNKAFQTENEEEVENIKSSLTKNMIISSISYESRHERTNPPFTTSTLIQAALNRYSITSARTTKIAQELYEGVEIGGKHVALITYMRTDSTRLSDEFVKGQLIPTIISTYGKEYLSFLHQQKSSENIQDAHEAIRPVSLKRTPESLKDDLSKDQLNLYTLIYQRTIASMMADSTINVMNVKFDSNGYSFGSGFEKYEFLGFQKAYKDKKISESLFDGKEGDSIKFNKISILKKETEGPQRFTEATLIKEMETSGIGRPSTYSSTMSTLKNRKYVTESKKKLIPSEQGLLTSQFLNKYYGMVINVNYTADMEKTLDEIAQGTKDEKAIVSSFYRAFEKIIEKNKGQYSAVLTGEKCPVCGEDMVYKISRYGRFEVCSSCGHIKKVEKPEISDLPEIECPECHKGHLVKRVAKNGPKKGKAFYGCSRYPDCKFTTSSLSIKKSK